MVNLSLCGKSWIRLLLFIIWCVTTWLVNHIQQRKSNWILRTPLWWMVGTWIRSKLIRLWFFAKMVCIIWPLWIKSIIVYSMWRICLKVEIVMRKWNINYFLVLIKCFRKSFFQNQELMNLHQVSNWWQIIEMKLTRKVRLSIFMIVMHWLTFSSLLSINMKTGVSLDFTFRIQIRMRIWVVSIGKWSNKAIKSHSAMSRLTTFIHL